MAKNILTKEQILNNIQKELNWCAGQNVSNLTAFLRENPGTPLVTCGMGGAKPSAHFMALLHGAMNGLGQAVTCYQLNAISDEALMHSKVCICTSGGHNNDVKFVARRLQRLKHPHAANFTLFDNPTNKIREIISKLPGARSINFCPDIPYGPGHSFVDIDPVVSHFALLCKAATGQTNFTQLDFNRHYSYTTNAGSDQVPDLGQIEHFIILYGHYGQPVAVDLESKLVESGFASVQLADYRDFTHGRFNFIGNHMDQGRTALVMLVSPREKNMVEKYYRKLVPNPKYKMRDQVLPDNVPVITITTDCDGPLASVDLILQQTKLYLDISIARGTEDIYNPKCPNIDKRVPQHKVLFQTEFKNRGPLAL